MFNLSEGALDAIMAGESVENPILQILGHKKLASSTTGERYRLLLSDGQRINSFTMLTTQLNHMVEKELTENTICQINRYALSNVNNSGKPKRIMVILGIEVKIPGHEVGTKIGNPTQMDMENEQPQNDKKPAPQVPSVHASPRNPNQRQRLDESISAGSDIMTVPIVALNPYQNRWVIKARVSNKSDIRTWSNSRGEGKLFSMDLVDESGEIRCTAFKEQCDRFYDMIEIGKVYFISRCTLKPANKQFSTLKNEYEMTMNSDTEIVACHDDVDDIPAIKYDFRPLSEVETTEKNTIIDVLAVVKSCEDVISLTARSTGRELRKRDVHIIDMSNVQVTLTLWGTQAENFSDANNPVIALKGVRIGEFNGGKNLSTLSASTILLDPDLPEAHRLRGWYNTTGKEGTCRVLSAAGGGGGSLTGPLTTFIEAQKLCQNLTDGAVNYMVSGSVSMIRKENALYKSCPSEGCKKKVVDQSNEMYRCEKCNREYPNFKWRLLAQLCISDATGSQWATAFNEEAEKIMGMSAQELGELKEMNPDEYDDMFFDNVFEPQFFKIRTRREVYNDEARLKSIVNAVGPVDIKLYNEYLLESIKKVANVKLDD